MKRFIAIIACAAISASMAFAQNDEYKHVFLQLQGGAAETIGESAWTNLISPSAAAASMARKSRMTPGMTALHTAGPRLPP